MGKNWACHQPRSTPRATSSSSPTPTCAGKPGALAAVVDLFDRTEADLLTVWPTQITVSWGERLTVPLIAMTVLAYLPVQLAHDFYHPLAAAANGQCMVFRRAAYAAAGGHAAVRGEIVEDVRLAQRIKAAGLKLRAWPTAPASSPVACMAAARHPRRPGQERAGRPWQSPPVAGLVHGAHLLLFLWPWLWLAADPGWALPGWPLWPLGLVTAGVSLRGSRPIPAASASAMRCSCRCRRCS